MSTHTQLSEGSVSAHGGLSVGKERKGKEINIYKTPAKSGAVFFRSKLVELGVDEQLANEWIEIRKNKKAALSEGAITRMITEVEKAKLTMRQAVEICCERAWQGFKAEWLNNKPGQVQTQATVKPPRAFHQD